MKIERAGSHISIATRRGRGFSIHRRPPVRTPADWTVAEVEAHCGVVLVPFRRAVIASMQQWSPPVRVRASETGRDVYFQTVTPDELLLTSQN